MKKITALILAIILCFTLAIPALGSEMSVNGQAYSINGIDVYKYPLKASQYFSVETIIYFVSDAAFAQVPVNDDVGVYLVTTMEEVTALASANPYAAIVIDANAEGLFDEELLVDLARTQHISTHKRVAFTLLASAKLYNSSGTVIKTLSKGDEVCFTIDDGYAGATRPYLISICGYTVFTNNLGYYTAVTSTTFVDLNFDCGYTSGYRVVTEIDWS